jgi:transcriptional regulator with XRE-family HTH domain
MHIMGASWPRGGEMSTDEVSSDEPASLPEQRVGRAMRNARQLAGISLRQMAKRLGYHSHTTLSSYERGAVMPTDEAVTGYERVLALAPGTLAEVLEAARIERHGDVWAKRHVHIPTEFVNAGSEASPPDSKPTGRRKRWLGKRSLIVAGSAIVILAAAFVMVMLLSNHHKATSLIGVRDGADPGVTGCKFGAVISASVDVYYPPQHLVGTFELRSSARCGTSWGRFVPISSVPQTPPWQVAVNVYRPADGAVNRYHVTYNGANGAAFGNMLISRFACVYATLTLKQQGQARSAIFQTDCRQAPAG